jgi:hypothetical protein
VGAGVIPVVEASKHELGQCVTKLKQAMGQPVSITRADGLVVRCGPQREGEMRAGAAR